MAQSSYFSRIFGNSPVSPLQKHIEKVVLCVEELIPYFDAVMKNDWGQAGKIQTKLVKLENDADEIKSMLRMQLPSSLFMPMDRRDVLDVLQLQDKIANKAKEHGKIAGIHNGTTQYAKEMIALGYQFVTISSDFRAMSSFAQNIVNEMKEIKAINENSSY